MVKSISALLLKGRHVPDILFVDGSKLSNFVGFSVGKMLRVSIRVIDVKRKRTNGLSTINSFLTNQKAGDRKKDASAPP